MATKITESQLKQLIRESLEEVMNEEGMDEGRFGNFFKSVGAGLKGLGNGTARQNYNDTMSNLSQADADAALAKSQEFAKKQNAGYADIPEVQAIAQKYDGKISKLQSQLQSLQQQKKSEMQAARRKYMSSMGKQASKFGSRANAYTNTAANAGNRAAELYNQRMTPPSSMQAQQRAAMEESKIERIIRESIKKTLNA